MAAVYRHRVLYGDTDQMGVVYYANYLRFFEGARNEWIRSLGISYREIEERGVMLPVLEVDVKYLRPARYDDLIDIEIKASHTRVRIRFDCTARIVGASGMAVACIGHTVHACMNKEGRPTRAPPWLLEALAPASTLRRNLDRPAEESSDENPSDDLIAT